MKRTGTPLQFETLASCLDDIRLRASSEIDSGANREEEILIHILEGAGTLEDQSTALFSEFRKIVTSQSTENNDKLAKCFAEHYIYAQFDLFVERTVGFSDGSDHYGDSIKKSDRVFSVTGDQVGKWGIQMSDLIFGLYDHIPGNKFFKKTRRLILEEMLRIIFSDELDNEWRWSMISKLAYTPEKYSPKEDETYSFTVLESAWKGAVNRECRDSADSALLIKICQSLRLIRNDKGIARSMMQAVAAGHLLSKLGLDALQVITGPILVTAEMDRMINLILGRISGKENFPSVTLFPMTQDGQSGNFEFSLTIGRVPEEDFPVIPPAFWDMFQSVFSETATSSCRRPFVVHVGVTAGSGFFRSVISQYFEPRD